MINDKLTKELQEQITENKDDINKLFNIQYINGETITPTVNCYAEVYGIFSGWGYGGNSTNPAISNTEGNATEVARADSNTSGHNTIPDAGMCMAVYRLNANTTYKFGIAGITGGATVRNILIKLIPLK